MSSWINVCRKMKRRDFFIVSLYGFLISISMLNIITVEVTAANIIYCIAASLVFMYETSRAGKAAIARQSNAIDEKG